MQMFMLAKRQGLAHQVRAPLAQRIIEAFDMCSLTSFFADGLMVLGWNDVHIWFPEVDIANRRFAIVGRERLTKLLAICRRTITKGPVRKNLFLSYASKYSIISGCFVATGGIEQY